MRVAQGRRKFGDLGGARRHLLALLARRVDPISALSSVRFHFGMQCSRQLEHEMAFAFLDHHGTDQGQAPAEN
jgi:hypothetical protein